MNTMMASGGYPWTIIPVEKRAGYMAALESASVDQDIRLLQYKEDEGGSVLRVPGKTLEATTTDLLLNFLGSADQILDLLVDIGLSGDRLDHAVQAGATLAGDWQSLAISDQITIINELVTRVVVSRKTVTIQLDRNCLLIRLAGLALDTKPQQHITLETAVNLRRSGIESKLVYPAGGEPPVHDRSVKALQEALLRSLKWNEDLVSGNVRSIDALIERDRLNPRQVHRLRKLAFLAPDIMERIIAGEVPETLTLERLKKDFPVKWAEQRSHFGLSQASH